MGPGGHRLPCWCTSTEWQRGDGGGQKRYIGDHGSSDGSGGGNSSGGNGDNGDSGVDIGGGDDGYTLVAGGSDPPTNWVVEEQQDGRNNAEDDSGPLAETFGTSQDFSAARAARKLASAAGSAGEICGERGASTHPFDPGTVFPLEVRYSSVEHAKYNSSGSSSSSSNDNTRGHDSRCDTICVGALLRPFDSGKRCRRSPRRGKAVLGVDFPFDHGRAWGRMQHGG